VSSGKPAGTIVEQAPKPGATLTKGSSVTLLVSAASTSTPTSTSATTTANATGTTSPATTAAPTTTASTAAVPPAPQTATMPDVTNQTEASAAQRLAQAGVLASIFFVPGNDPLGAVEQQAKPAGATLPYHAHVQINVSRGPSDNPLEHVPNVIGKDLQDAISALQATRLRLIYVKLPITSRARAGTIVQQSPLVGATAPQNAQILVFLGAYRPTH
jgi:beta-lactam-binding protein with PASTA domain